MTAAVAATSMDVGFLKAGAQPDSFDPYPLCARLRDGAPLWESPWGDIYLSSFASVRHALGNAALRRSPLDGITGAGGVVDVDAVIAARLREWLLFADDEKHTQLRRGLLGLFRTADIGALRPLISELTLASLQGASDRGDFVPLVSARVPRTVLLALLGLPRSDYDLLTAWGSVLRRVLDSGAGPDDAVVTETFDGIKAYFFDLVGDASWQSGKTAHGLASLLGAFPREAVAANLAMLAFVGQDTTSHLVGSMFLHLALRPGLWARLRSEPHLAKAAVNEALRIESPIQKLCRWTPDAIEIGGRGVEGGRLLVLLIGAAHRDPAEYSQPDMFDIDRSKSAELSFGWGAHLCLGRPLALLEGETILQTLLAAWQEVEVSDDGWSWLNNSSFRGLRHLGLSWRAARR